MGCFFVSHITEQEPTSDSTSSLNRFLGPLRAYCCCCCCCRHKRGRSRGYRGAVRATFFLPHKASTQFFRGGIPGRAAGLTWGLPRAPPAPWPRGERRRTGPACKDPALSSFLPRGCRPARSFLGWWRSLPAAAAGVTDDSADKKQKRTPNDQPQDFFTCSFGTFPQGGTQGQTRASVSALAV